MKKIIGGVILASLFFVGSAYAFVDCGMQFNNNPGDILSGVAPGTSNTTMIVASGGT